MDVILLAAGLGTRLQARTTDLPKAMIELCKRPLIDYALTSFSELEWVDRIVVVTGFQRDSILKWLDSKNYGKPIKTVHNVDYRDGNFYSLLCGLKEVGESWFNTNVDHIFPTELLTSCFRQRTTVNPAVDFDRPLLADCMKVQFYPGVRRVERIHKKLETFDCGYIGMTFISSSGREAYLAAVDKVANRNDRTAYAEMVVQELASQGMELAPSIVDGSGFGWLEVDDETDYQKATQVLREKPDFLKSGYSKNTKAKARNPEVLV